MNDHKVDLFEGLWRDYSYELYALVSVEHDCPQTEYYSWLNKLHEISENFTERILSTWWLYLALGTGLDWYLSKKTNKTVFKGTVLVVLLFVPFFALRLHYVLVEEMLLKFPALDCLGHYTKFSRMMIS